MSEYALAVFGTRSPVAKEYDDWYSARRLSDVLALPGFRSAQRLKCQIQAVGEGRHDWLMIYELDADTLAQAMVAAQKLEAADMPVSDGPDLQGAACAVIEICGPKVEAATDDRTGSFRLLALTNAIPGREAPFNDWYDHIHMPEVAAAPGFTWGKRYEAKQIITGDFPNPYVAIYGMEANSIAAAGEALQQLGAMNLTMTDAAGEGGSLAIFEAVTPRHCELIGEAASSTAGRLW